MKRLNLLLIAGFGILVALVTVSTTVAQSGERFALTWFAASNGSGTSKADAFAVQDFIGESVVGDMSGGAYSITTPFAGRRSVENLVLLYVGGDNNLADEAQKLVRKVQLGAVGVNAVIYMLIDGPGDNDNTLYLTSKFDPQNCNVFGGATCNGVYMQEQNMWRQESDSTGIPESLTEFLRFTISRHPDAKNIIVSVIGHGSGWSSNPYKGQPQEFDDQPGGLLWDQSSKSEMSTVEFGKALTDAVQQTGRKIDMLYLDACLMGMWEVAYEIQDSVNYLLAAESWSWTSFAYDKHLRDLQNSPSVPEIGRRWMDNESAILAPVGYAFTYSLLDLSHVETVRSAIDKMHNALDPSDQSIANALSDQICFDSNWDSQINAEDNYCDLYGFAMRLALLYPDDEAVKTAAEEVMSAIKLMVPEGNEVSEGGIAFDEDGNEVNWEWDEDLGGLSLYMPLRKDESKRRYYRDSTTSPLRASLDGEWDNFLDAYWVGEPPEEPEPVALFDAPARHMTIPPQRIFLPVVSQ